MNKEAYKILKNFMERINCIKNFYKGNGHWTMAPQDITEGEIVDVLTVLIEEKLKENLKLNNNKNRRKS